MRPSLLLGRRPAGMPAFLVIWQGQVLSMLGTRMTNFALSIFVWKLTHRATDVGLMTFFAFGATAVFSPIAGSLIDRWNRRLTIILSDLGSAAATLVVLVLFAAHAIAIWELFAVNAITGAFVAFQLPAYSATISVMMPKEHYARANAMLSMVRSVPGIFAPTVAAALLVVGSVQGVLLLDVISYVVAIGTVFLVVIPSVTPDVGARGANMWTDSLVGFVYIARRPGLRGLQVMLFAINLLAALGWIVLTPMILARTGNNQVQLGVVLTVGAIGGMLGGLAVSVLRPPQVKMPRILLGILVFSLLGRVMLGVGGTFVVWAAAWFWAWMCIPFVEGYSQAIWQEKVAPTLQGRVFAARQLIETLTLPLALAIAGPLADYYFEPQMRPGRALASTFGGLVPAGPGGGMALIFVVSGLLGVVVAIVGHVTPAIRYIETLLPAHDARPTAAVGQEGGEVP